MDNKEKLENIKSNLAALERQLEQILFPPVKLMLELQVAQLHKQILELEKLI